MIDLTDVKNAGYATGMIWAMARDVNDPEAALERLSNSRYSEEWIEAFADEEARAVFIEGFRSGYVDGTMQEPLLKQTNSVCRSIN